MKPHASDARGEEKVFVELFARGYVAGRSAQIFVVPEKGSFLLARSEAKFYQFMHGSPWDYDARIPLLLYGQPFIRAGTFNAKAVQQDVAPTIMTLFGSPVPTTMTGRVLDEALSNSSEAPRAVVLLVLDGVGSDTWQRYESKLVTLARLRKEGAWFSNASVNYLPTVTSTGHATIATGTDPRFHGIPGNAIFDRRSGKAEDPFDGMSPANYRTLTIADYWNLETSGQAVVIAQGGSERPTAALAGYGACAANGQKIVVAGFDDGHARWATNETCYRLPDYLVDDDASNIWKASPSWLGHDVTDGSELLRTGLFPEFQMDALIEMIDAEHVGKNAISDLVLINLKTPDYVSHLYGPASLEMEEALRLLDQQIGRLVETLDRHVGVGRYAMVITADHGMPPDPSGTDAGRYYVEDVATTIHERFDPEGKLVLNFEDSNNQLYIDHDRLESLNLTLEDVAQFVEELPFIRYAMTEDEIRATRLR